MTTQTTPVPFIESYPYRALEVESFQYTNIALELKAHFSKAMKFISTIDDDKLHFQYAEGKWSVADVLGHLIDHQLLFLHRALSFARKFKTPICAVDENEWAANSNLGNKSFETLTDLYDKSSKLFLTHISIMDKATLKNCGIANNIELSIEQLLAYMILHERHHLDVINTLYLSIKK